VGGSSKSRKAPGGLDVLDGARWCAAGEGMGLKQKAGGWQNKNINVQLPTSPPATHASFVATTSFPVRLWGTDISSQYL